MPPKKGKGKKGKKGKKGGLGVDPDEYKSFNVAQRQILQQLFEKMRENRTANDQARRELKGTLEDHRGIVTNEVQASDWYTSTNNKKGGQIEALKKVTGNQSEKNSKQSAQHANDLRNLRRKYEKDLENLGHDAQTLQVYLQEEKKTQDKKDQITKEIADLQVQHKMDKKNGMIAINEAEFEKIKDVKKLTEEMDFKVKETQANLMALNDEQLQTQTRLTILQNHQLTTELDYQSKNTETLVQTHDKMTKQIEVLKRNISLHKQIEKQLAKRAYKSQKVIAGLKTQVEQLERQKNAMINKRQPGGAKAGGPKKQVQNNQQNPADLEGEELIDFLETKLEGIEKKLAQSQTSYEEMQNNCLEINDKLSRQKEKYKRAALMLTEFLEDLMSQKPNILKEQAKFALAQEDSTQEALDIERIQQTPMENLSRDDKVRVVFILLKQLQPFLSAQNLSSNASFMYQGARSVGATMPTRQSVGNSIEAISLGKAYGSNRSTGLKQPLSNNFVNRSLQGGLPTQADSASVGGPHAAYNQTLGAGTEDQIGANTIQTTVGGGHQAPVTDPNGVSLTNLLTNIKVQRPADQL